ncbi:MAG: acyl-CoA dehydrogenase [Candidatus Entotheonellia bacterium]
MDLTLTPAEEKFRDECQVWLDVYVPREWHDAAFRESLTPAEEVAFLKSWQHTLYDGGWVGLAWPQEYGGRGATLMEQVIFNQAMARAKAPPLINVLGIIVAGPTMMVHGTEEQKRRYLPKILNAEEIWCQGFSEPNSGSDLASLVTRGSLDGDEFVVNGQKIWNSYGHIAQQCLLLVRTDPNVPKHKGISALIVDMQSPGVTVKPLRQITGDAEFNEVFFDNVRVSRANLVGAVNDGWNVAITILMFERLNTALLLEIQTRIALDELIDTARRTLHNGRPATEDPLMRQKLAQIYTDVEILRLTTYRSITRLQRGQRPGPEGSIDKLFWSETAQRLFEVAMEILGPQGQLVKGSKWAVDSGHWSYHFLRSRADTIAGGTSEILRNIIGERVLGLPKD